MFSAPQPSSPGSTFSTVGIICGAIAILFFPFVFGPAGLIFGAVAKSKGEQKAVVALVVSGVGLVVGMIFGYIVSSGL
jgi:membrane protein DedA with SNARE-associated domain